MVVKHLTNNVNISLFMGEGLLKHNQGLMTINAQFRFRRFKVGQVEQNWFCFVVWGFIREKEGMRNDDSFSYCIERTIINNSSLKN